MVSPFVCSSQARFNYQPDCARQYEINFLFTGNAGDFFWDFGDPTTLADTSLSLNPSYTYPGPGTYNARLITRGCVASDTFDTLVVVPPNPPRPSFSLPDTLFLGCNDSVLIEPINDQGGIFYRWNTGQLTRSITVGDTGVYRLRYENDICSAVDTVQVLPNPGGANLSDSAQLCGPADTVFWRGRSIASVGTYVDRVGIGSCQDTFNLIVSRGITTRDTVSLTACSGAKVAVNGNNFIAPFTLVESFPKPDGCDSLIFTIADTLPRSFTNIVTSICGGTSINFNGSVISSPGIYRDTMINSLGCDSIITLRVDSIINKITAIDQGLCETDTIGFSQAQKDSLNRQDTVQGIFGGCAELRIVSTRIVAPNRTRDTVELCPPYVFNGQDVTEIDSVVEATPTAGICPLLEVTYFNKLLADTINLQETLCEGDSLDFNGRTITDSGIYIDILTNQSGCDSIVELALEVKQLPVIEFDPELLICPGEFENVVYNYFAEVSIDVEVEGGQLINTSDTEITITWNRNSPEKLIRIIATDGIGCQSEIVREFQYIDSTEQFRNPILDCPEIALEFQVPNVITPNNDGFNDQLIIPNLEFYQPLEITIYDRWGREIYSNKNYTNDWGSDAAAGTYYYQITYANQVVRGWVMVVRG